VHASNYDNRIYDKAFSEFMRGLEVEDLLKLKKFLLEDSSDERQRPVTGITVSEYTQPSEGSPGTFRVTVELLKFVYSAMISRHVYLLQKILCVCITFLMTIGTKVLLF